MTAHQAELAKHTAMARTLKTVRYQKSAQPTALADRGAMDGLASATTPARHRLQRQKSALTNRSELASARVAQPIMAASVVKSCQTGSYVSRSRKNTSEDLASSPESTEMPNTSETLSDRPTAQSVTSRKCTDGSRASRSLAAARRSQPPRSNGAPEPHQMFICFGHVGRSVAVYVPSWG